MIKFINCLLPRSHRISAPTVVKLLLFGFQLHMSLIESSTSLNGASSLTLLHISAFPRGRMRLLLTYLLLRLKSLLMYWMGILDAKGDWDVLYIPSSGFINVRSNFRAESLLI